MTRATRSMLLGLFLACSIASVGRAANDTALRLSNASASNTAYVRIANSSAFSLQRFTLEAWVQRVGTGYGFTTDGGGASIISKPVENTVGSNIVSWHLHWTNAGLINFDLTHTVGSSGVYLNSAAVLTPLVRHHLAATFDGDTVRLFVDGALSSQAAWGLGTVYYGADDVLLGADNFGAGYLRRFDGYIDDVRIWDHALTKAQIAATMNCRLTGTETGLVAYFPFDSSSLSDATGHGHAGVNGGLAGSLSYLPLTALSVCAPVAVEELPRPNAPAMRMMVFPEPTRGPVTVRFDLAREGWARLDLVDVAGRMVGTLASGYYSAGRHEVARDLRNLVGIRPSAGRHYIRLESRGRTVASPVVLLR